MAEQHRLDNVDLKILKELQKNGRITNVELSEKVGISPPPCLRRVKSLEENGVINGYYADINESAVNLNVTVFAYLKLESQNEEDLKNFEAVVQNFDMVRECYMMSGDVDFVLKCVAPHWQDFQKFLSEKLTTLPNVKSIKTAIVCRISKKLSSAYFVE